ncbi:MAG: UvrD-helicase domain-containing protein, partial [Firmicutes bacterium]|nr:UvrD-helicase domain-containing protein [Bacillota bacterium]
MDILSGLNEQQLAAVTAEDRHVLVIAGAGSGKTRVLVSRVAWLMAQKQVEPYNIMAVTFTNKAANEMKERVEDMTGLNTRWMWMGTFHSLCARLLRMEAANFGLPRDFVIYDDGDTKALLKRVLSELQLDTDKYASAAVAATVSDAKNRLITSAGYEQMAADDWQRNVARAYRAYQIALKENGALDFDDLLCRSVWYLERHPEVLERWQRRFRHILVDEYQDTNHCQYRLIRLLAGDEGSVFAVGDPDQSIYRWRGADIANILDFAKDYPDCRELPLTQNYRSTQNILDAANALIANNTSRRPKDLFTTGERGEKIVLRRTEDDKEEASFFIRQVYQLQQSGSYNLNDCAILYRTHGLSRLFETECIRYGLPYRVFGGLRFYERKEVKDTIAYLRCIASSRDGEALRRIYNEPRRGIGKTSWERLVSVAGKAGLSPGEALAKVDDFDLPAAAKTKFRSLSGLLAGLREYAASSPSIRDLIRELWERSGYAAAIAASEGAEEKLDILDQVLDAAGDF